MARKQFKTRSVLTNSVSGSDNGGSTGSSMICSTSSSSSSTHHTTGTRPPIETRCGNDREDPATSTYTGSSSTVYVVQGNNHPYLFSRGCAVPAERISWVGGRPPEALVSTERLSQAKCHTVELPPAYLGSLITSPVDTRLHDGEFSASYCTCLHHCDTPPI